MLILFLQILSGAVLFAPHNHLGGKTMLEKTKVAVAFTCVFLALAFTGRSHARALELTPTTVYLADDGKISAMYKTTATTVEEFLAEENNHLNLHETDLIDLDFSTAIEEGLNISITRSIPVILTINDSLSLTYERIFETTVAEFITDYEEETGMNYVYRGSYEELIYPYMRINLITKTETVLHEEVAVPFETEIIESLDLLEGEFEIMQEGVEGTKVITTKKIYEADEEVDSAVTMEVVTQEPQSEIIKKGIATAVLTENGYKRYSQKIKMTATSYSLSFACTGKRPGDRGYGITASGIPADEGVVSVDPRVIPLGTKLYVEGYGLAIAADTGGAIKGNKIDLFYHDENFARKFGRQTRNVYILS